jgi:hypothetical protein
LTAINVGASPQATGMAPALERCLSRCRPRRTSAEIGAALKSETEMAFVEFAKKTGRAVGLTAAIVAAVSFSVAPGTAYAQRGHGGGGGWHGGGGGWHGGGGGWRGGGGWGGHRGGWGWGGAAIGLGILGGAAIANSYYGYPYSYGYGYPYYGGGYGYGGYGGGYYGGGYSPYGYGYGY